MEMGHADELYLFPPIYTNHHDLHPHTFVIHLTALLQVFPYSVQAAKSKLSSDVEQWKYLNASKQAIDWEAFPFSFEALESAIAVIPSVAAMSEGIWKVLQAVLHLGNIDFKGSSDDDAVFKDSHNIVKASQLLSCDPVLLTKALCTLKIKAGLDWIAKPNTTEVARSAIHALARALYSKLFDHIVDSINSSLMFGGDTRYFIGAVDVSSPSILSSSNPLPAVRFPDAFHAVYPPQIFGFESFARNSLEQLCINFANEKLQRMFTEAVFESVLAEYQKEGIAVGKMTFEDNSPVVSLIEDSPSGLLTLLSEECFFPNGSDSGWLGKIKEVLL